MKLLLAPLLASMLALAAPALVAQRPTIACQGQQISDVEVITRAPYEENGDRWWGAPLRMITRLHVTTRETVVRRYLLLHPGDLCVERLRAESERLLRAQPYLADASVIVLSDAAGGVVLRVVTIDELTAMLSVRADADAPWLTGFAIGEGNVGGRAMLVSGGWREGRDRNHWHARFAHHQFMGRPWILDIAAARRDVGFDEWTLGASQPFFTESRRFAWRAGIARRSEVFDFYRGADEPLAVALVTDHATLGGLVRVGSGSRLSLIGLALTTERARPGPPPPSRRIADVDYDALAAPFGGRSNARVNVLWGLRSLDYLRVERFDGLNATQDMARGTQLGVALGRSLSVLGTRDDDFLVAVDFYGGAGTARTFASLHTRAEARDYLEVDRWDGILVSATLAFRHRLHPVHTLRIEGNWSAGWQQQVPFQLPLGSHDGGVRGFTDGREAGGRRATITAEDRWYLGVFRGLADVGVAAFVDAGAVRPGDAPMGMRSPVRVGMGAGLIASLPPRSRRTWRLDFAVPLNSDGHARWEVRLSSTDVLRSIWREPPEVTRSREQAVPIGLFSWP